MATTGQVFPTAAVGTSEAPWSDNAWSNTPNLFADDGLKASVTAGTFDTNDQTQVLKPHTYDLSAIPDDATIDGVIVRIEASDGGGGTDLDLVQLLNTSRAKVGDNKCATTDQVLTTTDTVYTFGGATDLWGNALTPAWVKDPDFGVAIGGLAKGNNSQIFIDWATVEVFYTPAAADPVTGSGAIDLPAVASSGVGKVQVKGTGSLNLVALAASGTGTVETPSSEGSGSPSLPTIVAQGQGTVRVSGQGAPALPALSASGSSTVPVRGDGSSDLPALSAAGSAQVLSKGAGTPALPTLSASASGLVRVSGEGFPLLPSLQASGTAEVPDGVAEGEGTPTLPSLTAAGTATVLVRSSGSASMPPLVASGAARASIAGEGSVALPSIAFSGDGTAPEPERPQTTRPWSFSQLIRMARDTRSSRDF